MGNRGLRETGQREGVPQSSLLGSWTPTAACLL